MKGLAGKLLALRRFFNIHRLDFLPILLGGFSGFSLDVFLEQEDKLIYEQGMRYAYVHVLAILGSALAIPLTGKAEHLVLAAWLFIAGIVIYTGSLMLLALTGISFFEQITPIGGLSFLLGWGFFASSMR